jgi:hypothetical protein
MTIEENLKNATGSVALLGEVVRVAGDNPHVREAGCELGKAVLTVTKTINNCLLPLAAFNFGVEKAKKYFAEQFPNDMARKAAKIPAEEIVEPKASIAGPALQGLAFCHEEQDLKEMYLNLLASAMDGRMADSAHPAFVEIIKQLSSKEATLLQGVLEKDIPFMIGEIYFTPDTGKLHITTNTLYRHLLDFRDEKHQPVEDPFVPAMVDNWVRLGLVKVAYDRTLVSEDYSWVETRPEFISQRNKVTAQGTVTYRQGSMRATAWGMRFAQAVGLADAETLKPEK